jgi:hypothetical protein
MATGASTGPLVAAHDAIIPDLSGRWKLDRTKSADLALELPGRAVAAILGDECTITQSTETMTLDIIAGTLKVRAVYRLDGKPSENRSPGPPGQPEIPIVSTVRWIADALHISTKSESVLNGATVPVSSVRKIWLTPAGDLGVERQGTPAEVVPPGWAVYTRVNPPAQRPQ